MELTGNPDHVIRHEPPACRRCGTGLAGARQTGAERRQVTEIPPVKAEVTEHQMVERECPCCGERTKADAPDGVTAPVQYGPRAAALGTYLWHRQSCPGTGPAPRWVRCRLRPVPGRAGRAGPQDRRAHLPGDRRHHRGPGRSGRSALDETGFRVAGKLASVHSASAGKFVLVTVHPSAARKPWTPPGCCRLSSIACHDAWKPYDSYDGVAGHALCGAHLLRELIAATETGTADDVIWAQQAIDALLALKETADAARDAGRAPSTRRSWKSKAAGSARQPMPDRPEHRPPQQAAKETERPGDPDARPRR